MILLDKLFQYFVFITMIALSITFNRTVVLIYISLFMFIFYF
jgi:hypothetical protein